MSIRPISYTKEHPVAVVSCILIGMGLSHFGFGFAALPFVSARAKVSAGDGD
jgi:hypothetical protein